MNTITTNTSGGNAVATERQNLVEHQAKVLTTGTTDIERQNLAVHNQVVDQVIHSNQGLSTVGTGAPVVGSTAHATGNQIHGNNLENEQKPGVLTKVKEALHVGGHKQQ
ncbi:calcium-transporting ATPase plasma membrane-type [Acrasis kona]|uniref:Calcium-transporting ATPase plasma membrane-type n=1 Tax=Acrasis kona TaxID=1008807 RepID=A0AAW2YMG4_9EUKA